MKKLIIIALLTLSTSTMAASFVGQSGPDENGNVICYYEDFNTGETYIKHAKHVCPSQ